MATRAQVRRRQRAQRQKQRQEARQQRRQTRQENRTRRAQARAQVRTERVKQKGASGFFSPEGIKARGDVGFGLVDRAVDVGGAIGTGGLTGFAELLPGRRDSFEDVAIMNGVAATTPSLKDDAIGGGGGGGFLSQIEEDKPFYTNPLFIGGAVIGGFLLVRQFRKK